MAVIYANKGEHAKAEAILRKVLEICPDFPVARNNLAIALSQQGKTKEAEAMFASANKSEPSPGGGYPRTWEAARNLARLRHKEHDDAAALSVLEKAIRDYPGVWGLVSLEAQIKRETIGPGAALPIVQRFVDNHWWHAGASISLGGLFMEVGDLRKAEIAFRHASGLDVHDAEALNLIALLKVREDRLDDAYEIQQRAILRDPNQPRQYLLLSDILEKMGRVEEARVAASQVDHLRVLANAQSATQ